VLGSKKHTILHYCITNFSCKKCFTVNCYSLQVTGTIIFSLYLQEWSFIWVSSSLAHKCKTRVEVAGNQKHTCLHNCTHLLPILIFAAGRDKLQSRFTNIRSGLKYSAVGNALVNKTALLIFPVKKFYS
jgi:hypothetical protein